MPGDTADEKWERIRAGLSRFAGRELTMSEDFYESEASTNLRNQGIAHLLREATDAQIDDQATDVYTRQCSLDVTVHDLAVMAATLANGGVNPQTGDVVIVPWGVSTGARGDGDNTSCRRLSGDWLYEIGVPGKSGVSGGIVTVAPGKGGLATFSPPLDAGREQRPRGRLVTKYLSERLGLNLFASEVPPAIDRTATNPGRPVSPAPTATPGTPAFDP